MSKRRAGVVIEVRLFWIDEQGTREQLAREVLVDTAVRSKPSERGQKRCISAALLQCCRSIREMLF